MTEPSAPSSGSVALSAADYVYITNEDPCGEPPEQIMAEVARDLPAEARGDRFELEPIVTEPSAGPSRWPSRETRCSSWGKGIEQNYRGERSQAAVEHVEAARRAVEVPDVNAVLVYNPNAGRRRASQPLQATVQVLERGGWSVQLRRTSGPGDAGAIASAAARDGTDAVFAAGGDGTLNEAVRGWPARRPRSVTCRWAR